jgi:hypothetical protein
VSIIREVILDAVYAFIDFIKSNLITLANIINVVLPYAMYYIGQYVAINREKISFGGEVFIPVIIFLVIYILKSVANKIGKGITVPVPDKRFTQIDEDGEVSIENNRIQELILYMADLEDWMERKGIL